MPNPLACPQCAYVRLPSDQAPLSQCPACGIVFSQLRKRAASKSSPQKHHGPRSAIATTAGVLATIASLIGIVLISQHAYDHSKDVQTLVMLGIYLPIVSLPVLAILGLLAISLSCGLGMLAFWAISPRTGSAPSDGEADSTFFADA